MNRFNPSTLLRSPFGRSLAAIMVAFTLVPIVVLTAISLYNVQVQLRTRSLAQADTVVGLAQKTMGQWLGEASAQLASTLKNPAVTQNSSFILQASSTDNSRAEQVVSKDLTTLATGQYFVATYLVRPDDGDTIAVSSQADQKGQSLGIGLSKLEAQGQHAWGLGMVPLTGQPGLLLWQAVLDQRQQPVGFLVGVVNVKNLAQLLHENAVSLGQTAEIYLVEPDRLVITDVRYGTGTASTRPSLGFSEPVSGEFNDYAQDPVIGKAQALPQPYKGLMVAHQHQSEAFATFNTLIRVAALLSVILFVLAILAAVITTQQFSGPLLRLSDAARTMASGVFTRVDIQRRDEIGVLASSFNAMATDLQNAFGKLETSNQTLTTRAEQLSTITRVGQHITSLLDMSDLLPALAHEIQQAFGYYAVAVFLPDLPTSDLVGRAAAGVFANEFIATQTRRQIGNTSLVGTAAGQRKVVHVPDVTVDQRWVPHPLRPATRAEVSIPMLIGTNLMGVLDIQSDRANAFSPDEISVLQILASQLAVAIRNAELFKESEAARQAADDANRQKSEFLSNMSHELRTPLNVIIGYSHSILNRLAMYDHVPLPPVYDAGIRSIMNGGQHLLGLINDILDLSKIEAGQIDLAIESVDPLPILQGVRATALGLIKPGVQLRVDHPDKLPDIMGDELRVRQILLNLVSNAAKFTEQGFITLDAHVEGNFLRFSVADTGVGIAENARDYLFDRFRQADRSVAKKHGGTGLGLNISRQLTVMHGGEIGFDSIVGKGSTFYFTIPLSTEVRERTQPKVPDGRAEIVSSRAEIFTPVTDLAQQVLVVDMHADSQKVIRTALADAHFDVLVADDAERGWDMAEAVQPNIIVIHMRSGDPAEQAAMEALAEKCKQQPALSAANTPVIVLRDVTESSDPAAFVQQLLHPETAVEAADTAVAVDPVPEPVAEGPAA